GRAAFPAFQLSPTGRWVVLRTIDAQAKRTISLNLAPAETGVFHAVASNVIVDDKNFRPSFIFSPDDSQIAYLVDDGHFGTQGAVEVQAAAGGPPTRLADGASWLVAFSPGGAQLLYSAGTPATIWSAPTTGGKPHALLDHAGSKFYGWITDPFFVDDST